MDVIEEVPEGFHKRSLKKKIDRRVEEEGGWALFERAIEEIGLSESDLEGLGVVRESVWKDERKKLSL